MWTIHCRTAWWTCSGTEGAGGDCQGADWGRQAVEEGVGERKEEEEEEDDAQSVEREDGEAVWMLQGRAQGREAHVVTEGVTQHRAYQVTCPDEDKGCVGSEDCSVGELKHCREKDPRDCALFKTQQLNHVVEVGHAEEQGASEDGGGRAGAGDQHGQHAGPEHQLLSQRGHHLVPQPAHVAEAQGPEARVESHPYAIHEGPGTVCSLLDEGAQKQHRCE